MARIFLAHAKQDDEEAIIRYQDWASRVMQEWYPHPIIVIPGKVDFHEFAYGRGPRPLFPGKVDWKSWVYDVINRKGPDGYAYYDAIACVKEYVGVATGAIVQLALNAKRPVFLLGTYGAEKVVGIAIADPNSWTRSHKLELLQR